MASAKPSTVARKSASPKAKTVAAKNKPITARGVAAAPPASKRVPAEPRGATPPAATEKPKKPKLVRDSFTIPKNEYAVLGALKERAAGLGRPAKKSELLRAGIKALAAMTDAAFAAALAAVPTVKAGRPAKANPSS